MLCGTLSGRREHDEAGWRRADDSFEPRDDEPAEQGEKSGLRQDNVAEEEGQD